MRVRDLANWRASAVRRQDPEPVLIRTIEGQALVSIWNDSEKRREFAEMSVEDFGALPEQEPPVRG